MGFQVGNPAMRHPHVFFGVVVVHAVAVFVANVRISVRQQDARHRHVEAMGLEIGWAFGARQGQPSAALVIEFTPVGANDLSRAFQHLARLLVLSIDQGNGDRTLRVL